MKRKASSVHETQTTDNAQRPFMPYGRQVIDATDIEAVVQVLQSDWLTTGPRVEEFEQAVAHYVDANHGWAASSLRGACQASEARNRWSGEPGPWPCAVVPRPVRGGQAATAAVSWAAPRRTAHALRSWTRSPRGWACP